MNSILNTIHLINQPLVKEGVKNFASSATFVFGLVEVYDVCQIAHGRDISTEKIRGPKWTQVANKVVIVCAKISLILSACVSRPGVFIISSVAGLAFSTGQLDQTFGPNTIFAVNPWHPRHVISFVALALALPALAQSAYKAGTWACRQYQKAPKPNTDNWLTDAKIRLMSVFNSITSRPALHIGNHLSRLRTAV